MTENQTPEQKKLLRDQIKQQTVGYITSALGLVAGLAWNEAIKELIAHLYPSGNNTLTAKFIYAVIMTIVVVLMSVYLYKLFKIEDKK